MNNKNIIIVALSALTAALMLGTGCSATRTVHVKPETGHYYVNPTAEMETLGRVVVFEMVNRTPHENLSMEVTSALSEALQKRHLFSVKTLSSDDPRWKDIDVTPAPYSFKKMAEIREKLSADAVIVGEINQYYPYPHLMMSLHMKMIDLREGKTIWGLEQLWDSADKRLQDRMIAYYETHLKEGYQPLNWQILMTSPRAFRKFVLHEVAVTFPETNGYRLSSENDTGLSRSSTKISLF